MSEKTNTSGSQKISTTHDDVLLTSASKKLSAGKIRPEMWQQAMHKFNADDTKPLDECLNLQDQSQQEQGHISQRIPISNKDIRKLECSRTRSNDIQKYCQDRISSNNLAVPTSAWMQLFTSLFSISVVVLTLFITVKVMQYFWKI